MRVISKYLAASALCSLACAADLSVGAVTASPGQRARGVLQVPAGVDAGTTIPVIVINGALSGPTLALVAGAHGTEYASILALHRLAAIIDARSLSGAVVILPLLNIASFSQMVPHLNPVDGKNMNRFYPGKPDGTQTERVSWAVTKSVLEKCDYLIDYHGGDLDENLRRYAYWADTGQERLDSVSRGMVLAFGLDHIIIQHNRTAPAPGGPITVTRHAQMIGKPAIAVEAGHAGTTNAGDIDVLVDGTLNVMRHLKMLTGDVKPVEHPIWIGSYSVVSSAEDGVFHSMVLPEAYVQKGMTIGYVTDYSGEKRSEVTAPASGLVIYIRAVPSLRKGDNVAYIGEPVAGQ